MLSLSSKREGRDGGTVYWGGRRRSKMVFRRLWASCCGIGQWHGATRSQVAYCSPAVLPPALVGIGLARSIEGLLLLLLQLLLGYCRRQAGALGRRGQSLPAQELHAQRQFVWMNEAWAANELAVPDHRPSLFQREACRRLREGGRRHGGDRRRQGRTAACSLNSRRPSPLDNSVAADL